jgi:high-affinity iron transporter
MIESFVILLREGIEIALIVGILVIYLRKINQQSLLRFVYLGLGFAALASVVGAILFRRLGLDSEILEGYLLVAAAVFVASMIIWMWRTAKGIRREIEQKVSTIVTNPTSRKVQVGIFAFSFLMIFREGIETAVFLGAVSFGQGSLESFLGGLLGITGAVAFGVMFVKGSLRIDVGRFLKVTAVVLLIFVAQLLVNAVHEFFEMGILPPRPVAMGILGPVVRNNLLFILAILSIPAFMFMIPGKRRQATNEEKKHMSRRLQFATGLVALSIVFFLGFDEVFSMKSGVNIEPAQPVSLNAGVVRIPLNDVDDGTLHRYSLKQDSIEIRFLVLRTGLSSYATMFDACRPCYNYGKFYISGDNIVCSQCGAAYPLSRVSKLSQTEADGRSSAEAVDLSEDTGCLPIYLPSRIENGTILISLDDLQSKREYFELKKEEPRAGLVQAALFVLS